MVARVAAALAAAAWAGAAWVLAAWAAAAAWAPEPARALAPVPAWVAEAVVAGAVVEVPLSAAV